MKDIGSEKRDEALVRSLIQRLVWVLEDLTISEYDCGQVFPTRMGPLLLIVGELIESLEDRIAARVALEDVRDKQGHTFISKGELIRAAAASQVDPHNWGEARVAVRSPLTCQSQRGVCALCYGSLPGSECLVEIGKRIGMLAAQAVAEGLRIVVSTRISPRMERYRRQTFDLVGGPREREGTKKVANTLGGLPYVVQLLEARTPRKHAVLSPIDGIARCGKNSKGRSRVEIVSEDGRTKRTLLLPLGVDRTFEFKEGQRVRAGESFTDGPASPHDILDILGQRALGEHLMLELQNILTFYGARVNDKHLEVLLRPMIMGWAKVDNPGNARFRRGELVSQPVFREENEAVMTAGGNPALGRPVFLGLSKLAKLLAKSA